MKTFTSFIAEAKGGKQAFHVSPSPLKELGDTPMWTTSDASSTSRDINRAYYNNSFENHGTGHAYKFTFKPGFKVADLDHPKVRKILNDSGVKHEDYNNHLVSNPTAQEVRNHPGTQALMRAGYHGVSHTDYDPRNYDKDIKTTVVLNPSDSVHSFERHSPWAY